jgi:hypothetical protein
MLGPINVPFDRISKHVDAWKTEKRPARCLVCLSGRTHQRPCGARHERVRNYQCQDDARRFEQMDPARRESREVVLSLATLLFAQAKAFSKLINALQWRSDEDHGLVIVAFLANERAPGIGGENEVRSQELDVPTRRRVHMVDWSLGQWIVCKRGRMNPTIDSPIPTGSSYKSCSAGTAGRC